MGRDFSPPAPCLTHHPRLERRPTTGFGRFWHPGEVAEWSNAPHSKCGIGASLSGVRIPPSPPLIFGDEKVLQNQAFLEPPAFGGVAPRWSTAASPSCHLSIRLASQKGSLAAPLSRGFPPARTMGQECATPKVLTKDGRATFPEFPPF